MVHLGYNFVGIETSIVSKNPWNTFKSICKLLISIPVQSLNQITRSF